MIFLSWLMDVCFQTLSSVEDSPSSKLSQATIETIPERSNLESEKLFLSQDRPFPPPGHSRLTPGLTGHHMPPEMTQSLHSHVNMQNMQTLKTMPNLQFNMPPEMTQSLHSQVKEENSQNMQHMPRMHNMQYDVSGLQSSAADQLSQLQRFSMKPNYQFIEDYENISPRLIHNANLMHHVNSLQRTSLLGKQIFFLGPIEDLEMLIFVCLCVFLFYHVCGTLFSKKAFYRVLKGLYGFPKCSKKGMPRVGRRSLKESKKCTRVPLKITGFLESFFIFCLFLQSRVFLQV